MKFRIPASCLFLVFFHSFLFSQSKIVEEEFFSVSLDTTRNVNVYLPDGYNSDDTTTRYPVVYFLHGGGGNHNSYNFIIPILDSLISNRIINPIILVKPDGSCEPYLGSQYFNSELYGRFEDYIVFDAVEYIDVSYNTNTSREKRCIMGHSMGGEGAMRLAIKHPDIYSGVVSHSGVVSISFLEVLAPLVVKENENTDIIDPSSGYMTEALFTASGGYSPNVNNPPFFVDLPIDKNGKFKEKVMERWLLNDPGNLAEKYNPESNLKIFFDCGTRDPILKCTAVFAEKLSNLGIPFIFHSYVGQHNDKLSERFSISLKFLNAVMQ